MNKENLWFLITFALAFLIFGFKAQYHAALDTVPARLLPVTLLTEGNIDYNEFNSSIYKDRYWYQSVNGKQYSSYSIIPGLLNVPVFAIAKLAGKDIGRINKRLSLITCLILTALTIAFHYLIANFFFEKHLKSAAFALLYGLGTAYWSVNSRGLWEHTPAVLFLSIALYLLLKNNISWSGFFLGFAVFSRPVLVILAVTLSIYVIFVYKKDVKKFIILSAIPAALFFAYNYFYLGGLFAPFHSNARSISLFNAPSLNAFLGLLFSPARGLLIYSPFLFVAAMPIKFIFTKSFPIGNYMRFLVVGVFLQFLLICCWSNWWGGHSFSYRLLIDLLPALFILIAFYFALIEEEYILPLTRILFLASVTIHFLGAYMMPCGANQKLNIDEHPENLWVIRNCEVLMCAEKALKGFAAIAPIDKE
jgi:hypothetical protein